MSAPKTSISKAKGKVTRQMKRNATMHVKAGRGRMSFSKEVKVLDFITGKAKRLPPIVDRQTKEPFDHVEIIKKIYMESGIEGVNEYIHACRNVWRRDKGKSVWIRAWGRTMLFIGKRLGIVIPYLILLLVLPSCIELPVPTAKGVALLVLVIGLTVIVFTVITCYKIMRTLKDMDRMFKNRDSDI